MTETVFRTQKTSSELIKILTETVGPRTFWLHHSVGGPGWFILNTGKSEKTVVIQDPQLATLTMLKLK